MKTISIRLAPLLTVCFIAVLLLFLSGCFYGKVAVNDHDRWCIPYSNNRHVLVFVNNNNQYDTVILHKSKGATTNFDFYIDKKLGHTTDKRKPYYVTYRTTIDEEFSKTMAKSKSGQPYIKAGPFIFAFNKYQGDSLLSLYYSIDGRWQGNIYFHKPAADTITVNGVLYKDVITLRADTILQFNIDNMYWSLQHGLIRINERGGAQWNLVNQPG